MSALRVALGVEVAAAVGGGRRRAEPSQVTAAQEETSIDSDEGIRLGVMGAAGEGVSDD